MAMMRKKFLVPMLLGQKGECPFDVSLVDGWPSDGRGFGYARLVVSIWGNDDGDYPMSGLDTLSTEKGIGIVAGQMMFVPMLAVGRIKPEGAPMDLEEATSAVNITVRRIIQSNAAGKEGRFPRHWTVCVEVEMVYDQKLKGKQKQLSIF